MLFLCTVILLVRSWLYISFTINYNFNNDTFILNAVISLKDVSRSVKVQCLRAIVFVYKSRYTVHRLLFDDRYSLNNNNPQKCDSFYNNIGPSRRTARIECKSINVVITP